MSDLKKMAQEELVRGGVGIGIAAATFATLFGGAAVVSKVANTVKKRRLRKQIRQYLDEHYEDVNELDDEQIAQCLVDLTNAGVEYPEAFSGFEAGVEDED